jgi:hypothetical protein
MRSLKAGLGFSYRSYAGFQELLKLNDLLFQFENLLNSGLLPRLNWEISILLNGQFLHKSWFVSYEAQIYSDNNHPGALELKRVSCWFAMNLSLAQTG